MFVSDQKNTIQRKVIEQGMFVKQCKVEIYLMTLKLLNCTNQQERRQSIFSRLDTINWYLYNALVV